MSALYHQFAAFTFSGLTEGVLYALMAFGYTIVYRILGLFNFAHGGVFMVGTFAALFAGRSIGAHAGAGVAGAIGAVVVMAAAAIVTCTLVSVALEYSVYRPIRVRTGGGLAALVAGLGMIAVLQEIMAKWQGRDQVSSAQPVSSGSLFKLLGGAVHPTQIVVVVVGLVVLFAAQRYVNVSRLGRALRAVGQDAKTASLMGINVERVVVLSFALAGATAGIAAVLQNLQFGSTWYYGGFSLGIKGLTAALLGGMGSVPGAIAGGIVLGLTESYGGAILGAEWQDVIAFGALILILVVRPTGIIGERMALVRA
jgi:branched-chain amino acid transport system permease protein